MQDMKNGTICKKRHKSPEISKPSGLNETPLLNQKKTIPKALRNIPRSPRLPSGVPYSYFNDSEGLILAARKV